MDLLTFSQFVPYFAQGICVVSDFYTQYYTQFYTKYVHVSVTTRVTNIVII